MKAGSLNGPAARGAAGRGFGRGLLADRRARGLVLVAVLALSAHVHLWNPAGFPDLFFDEGIYMRRAMTTAETGNPQEADFYDHPYFGQLVLAGFVKLAGFPGTVEQSLEASYLAPRVLMGLFAVLDTFLIYKISEKRFGRKTAVLASVLFAAMPLTWMFRRILLDSILMPFLLSSVLLALHSGGSRHRSLLVASSSVLLGLAIFTKVTAVTMVPVVAFIIASHHGFRGLAWWLPPVVAVPAAWPAVAAHLGQIDLWLRGVLWQGGRGAGQFWPITGAVFAMDPVLAGLGFAGLAYAAARRDALLVLWLAPFLLFVSAVGFFQYFHYILILPAMCVAAAHMISSGLARIGGARLRGLACAGIALGFAAYGGAVSTSIASADLTGAQFRAMQYAVDTFDDEESTLVAGPVYTWVLSSVHGRDNVLPDYGDVLFRERGTDHAYLVVDPHFVLDFQRGERLSEAVRNSTVVRTFSQEVPDSGFPRYAYESTTEGSAIEIRASIGAPRP